MRNVLLSYKKDDTLIHSMTGATKLICLIVWTMIGMLSFDTRILGLMFVLGTVFFAVSRIRLRDISFILIFMLAFLALNNLAIFAFSPYEGVKIYGTRTNMVHLFGSYTLTAEQLFYQFNISLKYFTLIPIAILFIVTTDPSEFAASLNRLGVNYKISYSVALSLRYIPDITREYHNISVAAQARGIDISKKESFIKRVKNAILIVVPLIFSSFERIESISNAMELRRFGKLDKRTWYAHRELRKRDYAAITFFIVFFIVSMVVTYADGNRFFNPFL